jgi:glutamine amidotransferase
MKFSIKPLNEENFYTRRFRNYLDGVVSPCNKAFGSDKKKFKVPNIGWYNLVGVSNKKKNEIECLNEGKYYHVHSYYSNPVNKEKITHFIEYNKKKICVSYKENNNLGVQFHPEKSRQCGLNFLKFFSSL